ncbi:High-affinity branched-chain amino acid transport ATP-binding protein LivF [Fusobacterium sp. DD29]|uniref:ABC transporter ATP-binding protein n=1 Tax=unclassified Fusobacterium TaxID=2648384 RepID=UPI001B8CE4A1|nr:MULTISPECIES: ABC transporter ATP-binding protein [unclassified Fusobacterium]MBR8701222.1 High-affinity branched-chain amino acid transport ATP-binding protein LivF [Fusobacterium sp. DD45]MBR8710990.1 High-affinity branched-chain amino acid transport ATP-binding protein LivF [Fusobacterium sp. DD28]MBR8748877.1 High-affinity branched-chain amino acid transport ATP-binding protein LivF [Fusobacterium sp. DD29]MBR8751579.1 High-affinity branched-chain amino acid transport ATP-binding protein
MEKDYMLEIDDLHVYYDNIHALKGISLKVKQGEVVSLIGANGAGKTTTLQTISGLIQSKKGKIRFQGEDITKSPSHLICKKGIAQVPEGRRIFAKLLVKDNLKLGAFTVDDTPENLEKDRAKFYEVFPRMSERKNQMAGTLSGGEQQMLAMGRALMSRPKLLILDEPSMGLSPLFVKEIFGVIKRLKEAGVTILLVEQNAKMALSVADYAYVIETGKITMEGKAKELLHNPDVKKAYLGA